MNDVIRTLLYSYPSINEAVETIDKVILYKALSSCHDNRKTFQQFNDVIDLIDYSTRIYEAKCIIDKMLCQLTEEERQLVEYKFFCKKDKKANFNPCARVYFRSQLKLEKKIDEKLAYLNATEAWFFDEYGDINFLKVNYYVVKKMSKGGGINSKVLVKVVS